MTGDEPDDDYDFGDDSLILADDLASFVPVEARHKSMTVVLEPGARDMIAETRQWLDKIRAGGAGGDMCKAMRRAVDKCGDGSRAGQLSGVLMVVRYDERGCRGLAVALDELWSVRAKDDRDFRRMVESAREVVLAKPSPAGVGCRCDGVKLPTITMGGPGMAAATSATPSDQEKAEKKEPQKSVATRLVELAERDYQLGCTPDGEPYAIPKQGPPIVRQLRGGRQSLRAELARSFYVDTGATASQTALADACLVLEGMAHQVDPEELHMRVARVDVGALTGLVLDLGDATGRCVLITPGGWGIVDTPPVRFRRSALTGVLPDPVRGADVDELWKALNVAERYRPVLLAVLVSELIPDIPHPIVLFSGEHGTGKSTGTARCAAIFDPSPAQLRKAPRDADSWTTAAAGSWVVALDNLSGIPDWLSDALCRASTGDGDVRRRLYTDGDLHVIAFRRCVIVNGIDLGSLRGDLADRLVHLALELISEKNRVSEKEMADQWRDMHPRVLGALLDLAVQVLTVWPTVALDSSPRMADFAHVLAAVDQVMGTSGLDVYRGLRAELAEDAITSDPVLVALARVITEEFVGASAELLPKITPVGDDGKPLTARQLPKDWPATARSLTTVLTRQAPTLRQLGWTATKLDKSSDPRGKAVRWHLAPPAPPGDGAEQREGANHPANAADAANDLFSQVNPHAPGAANGAATLPQDEDDAAPDANAAGRGNDAAPDAAPPTPRLTSANKDHAASAACAALNAPSLRSAAPKCTLCGLQQPGPRDPNGYCTGCIPTHQKESA
jgi:hypothetical protein